MDQDHVPTRVVALDKHVTMIATLESNATTTKNVNRQVLTIGASLWVNVGINIGVD